MGVGQGIHPGRVVWAHAPDATSWDGKTGNWWDDTNTDQRVVDRMVSDSLQSLTGEATDRQAWDAIFRHFNRARNLGDTGYQPGEKIAIKINANQDRSSDWGEGRGLPSPHVISAVLAQLVNTAGVPAEDIAVYDATEGRGIGAPVVDKVRADPSLRSVKFVVGAGHAVDGRIAASPDPAAAIHFAKPDIPRALVPTVVSQSKYLINLALFRAHFMFGVTLTAKNHFGSVYFESKGTFSPSPLHGCGFKANPEGSYNCLVDLIGHKELGGKTLLYLLDGLYPAKHNEGGVMRFASFGDDWASSLFMSQDPLAIDSVALDFLRNEPRLEGTVTGHVDNYLHEAAMLPKPPSGTLYDPSGEGKPPRQPGRPRALEQRRGEEVLPQPGQERRHRARSPAGALDRIYVTTRRSPFAAPKVASQTHPSRIDWDGSHGQRPALPVCGHARVRVRGRCGSLGREGGCLCGIHGDVLPRGSHHK